MFGQSRLAMLGGGNANQQAGEGRVRQRRSRRRPSNLSAR